MRGAETMTPFERVLASLGRGRPDRVPYFLLFTERGARECGMRPSEYFRDPEAMAEGQLRLQERFGQDCYYGFAYAAVEAEAWGAEVSFTDEGPPLAASLLARDEGELGRLRAPAVAGNPPLERILRLLSLLRRRAAGRIPVIGVVLSPFSAPAMQLGFGPWLELLAADSPLVGTLLERNLDFCLRWGRAQLEAGADFLAYFDPLSSSDMVPEQPFRRYAKPLATRAAAELGAPLALHLASARALPRLGELAETGAAAVAVSARDDLAAVKRAAGNLGILGNLDGIAMRRWTPEETERQVRAALRAGAPGGGFILSDNHGEIPWSVPDSVLEVLAETVRSWGSYPLSGSL